jgi:hypothetical protein
MGAVLAGASGENIWMNQRVVVNRAGNEVLQAVGKMEFRVGRNVLDAAQQFRVAMPADFDAAEQVGFRPRHVEQPLRLERRLAAKNLGIRLEAHAGAATIVDLAEPLELALRLAALERH